MTQIDESVERLRYESVGQPDEIEAALLAIEHEATENEHLRDMNHLHARARQQNKAFIAKQSTRIAALERALTMAERVLEHISMLDGGWRFVNERSPTDRARLEAYNRTGDLARDVLPDIRKAFKP